MSWDLASSAWTRSVTSLREKTRKSTSPGFVQDGRQGPVPVGDPPFGVVREDEGFGHRLVRRLGPHRFREDGLIFLVGVKVEVVAPFGKSYASLRQATGIGPVHPDKVEVPVQEDLGGEGVFKKGVQQPGLFPKGLFGPVAGRDVDADASHHDRPAVGVQDGKPAGQ